MGWAKPYYSDSDEKFYTEKKAKAEAKLADLNEQAENQKLIIEECDRVLNDIAKKKNENQTKA